MFNTNKTLLKRCAIALIFVILAGVGLLLSNAVKVNYNLADYLDESTGTRAAIDIITDEFGMTGNVQVMVRDVDAATANQIKNEISAVDGVLMVSFDDNDPNSYKDGTALFVVLIDSDDYSSQSKTVVANIQELLNAKYDGVEYGGSIVKQAGLMNSTKNEMSLIIAVVIVITILLLMLTAKSWIEPFVLLAASGVAIAINMGLDIFLGEISFITKSISSILQLALSIDYSIVLLHAYRDNKKDEPDHALAMKKSVKQVVSPVAASALTTMAGLFALLFMAFRIGFDIGVVLIKGIVVSAVTSLTLLPVLVLLLEKLLDKTAKKEFIPKGEFLARFAFKANKIVAPIALVFIVLGGILQSFNTYIFTDSKGENTSILNDFGKKSSIVLVYKQGDNDFEREVEFYDKIKDYTNADGKLVLEKYNSYATSVREVYDLDKIESKLGLSRSYGEMLFAMYSLYNGQADVKLSFGEFIDYTQYLIENDSDVSGMLDENMVSTIDLISKIGEIMGTDYTAEEFADVLSSGTIGESDISAFAIKQMYGLYFFDTVDENERSLTFEQVLDKLIESADDPNTNDMIGADMKSQLLELKNGIATLRVELAKLGDLDSKLTVKEFETYLKNNFSISLPIGITYKSIAETVFEKHLGHKPSSSERVMLVDLLYTIPRIRTLAVFLSAEKVTQLENIKNYKNALNNVDKSYAYTDYIPALKSIVKDLTGNNMSISVDASAMQQIYIMYFTDRGMIDYGKIAADEFVSFIKETVKTNSTVESQLGADTLNKLDDLETIDVLFEDESKYGYAAMSDKINGLIASIKSVSYEGGVDESKISGVYIKYIIRNEVETVSSLMAFEFVNFICDNMETNSLLASRMTDDHKALLSDAQAAINSADGLLIGTEHSRALLTVNLASESAETTAYIDFLLEKAAEVFGDDAYITGEVCTTYDLQNAFAKDNVVISVFTIISIFLIILFVFKSISLPVVLVTVIQGAVWISLATQLVGNGMFFMSYIVALCVLMGATIDYGILMSSTYVNLRAEKDKKEALIGAVATATPTVFTSGIILIICGFVISLISTQNSISSVGDMLARGTIVSVIMITLVLPSVLYLLDKFILKFTMKKSINVKELISKIKNANVHEIISGIKYFFLNLGANIKRIAVAFAGFIKNAAKSAVPFTVKVGKAIANGTKLVIGKIATFFKWLGAKIKDLFCAIKPKIAALFTKISDFVKNFIEKIKTKK